MCRTLRQITAALERDTAAAGKNVNYGGALFDYDLVADSPDRALSMMMALVSDAADVLLATDHANPDGASPTSETKTCSRRPLSPTRVEYAAATLATDRRHLRCLAGPVCPRSTDRPRPVPQSEQRAGL